MKKLQKLFCLTLAIAMLAVCCIPAYAFDGESKSIPFNDDEVHTLVPYPPVWGSNPGEVTINGDKPPASSASTHNLALSAYNYQITKVGAQVYTDKWLTGATKIKVTVENFKKTGDYYQEYHVKIAVYNSSGTLVTSAIITDATKNTSVTLSGLTASAKYYVEFSVPRNTNTSAFNGSISKV